MSHPVHPLSQPNNNQMVQTNYSSTVTIRTSTMYVIRNNHPPAPPRWSHLSPAPPQFAPPVACRSRSSMQQRQIVTTKATPPTPTHNDANRPDTGMTDTPVKYVCTTTPNAPNKPARPDRPFQHDLTGGTRQTRDKQGITRMHALVTGVTVTQTQTRTETGKATAVAQMQARI